MLVVRALKQQSLNLNVQGSKLFSEAIYEALPRPKGDYVKQRSAYNLQMTELRKVWMEEHRVKKEQEEDLRRAEKSRITLNKAVRLREFRKAAAVRKVADIEKKNIAKMNYREHLARQAAKNERKDAVLQLNYAQYRDQLVEESSTWINDSNIDSMITPDLFDKPATTGIVTKTSDYWRNIVIPYRLDYIFNPEFSAKYGNGPGSKQEEIDMENSDARMGIKSMLNEMIGTGHDRQNYREIVEKFVNLQESHANISGAADVHTGGSKEDRFWGGDETPVAQQWFNAEYDGHYDDDDRFAPSLDMEGDDLPSRYFSVSSDVEMSTAERAQHKLYEKAEVAEEMELLTYVETEEDRISDEGDENKEVDELAGAPFRPTVVQGQKGKKGKDSKAGKKKGKK